MSDPKGRPPALRPDDPQLVRLVPHLAPETLHRLIQLYGLEGSGDLVAAATAEQLTVVLDQDLWRHPRPGLGEQFDADRFGEWLEALADHDSAEGARIVAALDPRLVVVGLSKYIRVFDLATFEPSASSDDEPMHLGGGWPGPTYELGGCAIRALRADAWDAILAILQGLETDHPASFRAVMQGCRQMSDSAREVDGLDELLTTPEQALHDIEVGREHRRQGQGYSTPSDARAFLELARQRGRHAGSGPPSANPIATAYFRTAEEALAPAARGLSSSADHRLTASSVDRDIAAAVEGIVELLAEAGQAPARPRALLAEPSSAPARFARVRSLMADLREHDGALYHIRTGELAFLTNILIAGCAVQGRAFTPQEASDGAVGICNLGLEVTAQSAVANGDLIAAFESGWAALHEVCLLAARTLAQTLVDLRCSDAELLLDLHRLRIALTTQLQRGTPWQARGGLDVISILDAPAWMSLLGLLNECPVIPAALRAVVECRPGTISPTAFEFISTRGHIDLIGRFLTRLPDILRS